MSFPDLQPIRKAILPNPQTTATLDSLFFKDSRLFLYSKDSERKESHRLKTQVNQSYRARNNRNTSEKLKSELKSNLTSLYQRGWKNFEQQRQEIKVQKQRKSFLSNNLSLLISTVQEDSKSFYVTQNRRQNIQSIKTRQYIIKNPLRYKNKTNIQREQLKTRQIYQTAFSNKVKMQDKRYKELTLMQILETNCNDRLFNSKRRTNRTNRNIDQIYEGW